MVPTFYAVSSGTGVGSVRLDTLQSLSPDEWCFFKAPL